MNTKILKFEGLFAFLLSVFAYYILGENWLLFLILILAPDLSMLGYLRNEKLGAIIYNSVHNFALSTFLILAGFSLNISLLITFGIILSAHIGADRALGYGLKLETGFKNTHLGKIGK